MEKIRWGIFGGNFFAGNCWWNFFWWNELSMHTLIYGESCHLACSVLNIRLESCLLLEANKFESSNLTNSAQKDQEVRR